MDTKAAICAGILFVPFVIAVIAALVRRAQASRCPQCGRRWAKKSGPVYPHGPAGQDRQATTFYRCQQCGFTWSKSGDE